MEFPYQIRRQWEGNTRIYLRNCDRLRAKKDCLRASMSDKLWLAKCIVLVPRPFRPPFFLQPSTQRHSALVKTWLSSFLNTWPYQRTPFAIDNWCMVYFKPNNKMVFTSVFILGCTPLIALTMDLHKIPISLSFKHHSSLPYRSSGLT